MEMKLGIYHIEITKSFEMNTKKKETQSSFMHRKVSLLTTDSKLYGLLTLYQHFSRHII